MRLAIMQPYLFPYIGYFQLINAVDKFIVYDDVNFIKQGWINRNNILVQGKSFMFTVPLKDQSSFRKINEVYINEKSYDLWRSKFLKTLMQSYQKAPFFDEIYSIVCEVLYSQEVSVSKLAVEGLIQVYKYLKLEKEFIFLTSTIYNNNNLSGKERVIDICKTEKAHQYINPIGGEGLYNKDYFKINGIELSFIKPFRVEYKQYGNDFIPWLSIIDVLMFNSKEQIIIMFNQYELI